MTQHFYIESASASGATIATLLGGAGIPTKDLVAVHDATTRGGAPYRMAETNTFYQGGKPGVSDAFASALWSIDYLFAIAENGGVGANFESLGANPSTPLADQNGSISEVRPLFYGLVFFTLAGPGRVLKTTTPSTNAAVSVHGLARTAGGTSLFVVNKDATHPADVTVDLGRPVTSASARALTAPSLDAKTGVAIQGSTIGLDGAFAPKPPSKVAAAGHAVTLIVPPGSAALVDVP
jgi:hypothetical protein